jgi:hypothetical protein
MARRSRLLKAAVSHEQLDDRYPSDDEGNTKPRYRYARSLGDISDWLGTATGPGQRQYADVDDIKPF